MTTSWRRLAAGLVAAAGVLAAFAASAAEAASTDGRWSVSGEAALVVVRDEGRVVKTLAARSLGGREDAAVEIVRYLPARRSFLIAFDARLAELWELSVDPDAPPIFDGLVHDYRTGEALASNGFLGIRRTRLEAPVHRLVVGTSQAFVMVRSADESAGGPARLALLNLDVRRTMARWQIDADPDFDRAITVERHGRSLIELPDRRGGPKLVVDLRAARLTHGD